MITEFINYLVYTKGYSQNTARMYESALRSFAKAQRNRTWSSITKDDIVYYLQAKKALGASSNTIIANISAIRGMYNWLCREYSMPNNPAKFLQSPKKASVIPHILSGHQIASAISAEDNDDIKLAIMLMASVGLRVSEARNLRYEDIIYETSSAIILGKGQKERTVYFPSYITEAIRARKHKEGYIFANWEDRAFRYAIYQSFARIGVQASPHMLRHSFASMSIDKGMRLDILRELMGHTSITTTQIYLHASSKAIQSEYNKIYQ